MKRLTIFSTVFVLLFARHILAATDTVADDVSLDPATSFEGDVVDPIKTTLEDLVFKPIISVTPATTVGNPFNYGDVEFGSMPTETLTVTNIGTGDLTIGVLALMGDAVFTLMDNNCDSAVLKPSPAAGSTCTVKVKFAPTSETTSTTTVAIPNDSETDPAQVFFKGTGVQAGATLTPIDFDTQRVDTTSSSKVAELKNTGSGPLVIDDITAAPTEIFAVVAGGSCQKGATLTDGSSCTIKVTFSPDAVGEVSDAKLTVTSSSLAVGSVKSDLSGEGVQPGLKLTPDPLAFGGVDVGAHKVMQVTVKNTGTDDMDISSISVGGGADFSWVSDNCDAAYGNDPLAPKDACIVNVRFAPSDAGTRPNGTLTVASDAPASDDNTVTLTGTGLTPAMVLSCEGQGDNCTSVDFGAVKDGEDSETKTVTVTNKGNQDLNLSAEDITGDFDVLDSSTCPKKLDAEESCAYKLVFSPTDIGDRAGKLAVNASNSDFKEVALSGVGYNNPTVKIAEGAFANTFLVTRAGGPSDMPALRICYGVNNSSTAKQGEPDGYEELIPPTPIVTIPQGAYDTQIEVVPGSAADGSKVLVLDLLAADDDSCDGQSADSYTVPAPGQGGSASTPVDQSAIPPPRPIPAISLWGVVLLGGLLGVIGAVRTRRYRVGLRLKVR